MYSLIFACLYFSLETKQVRNSLKEKSTCLDDKENGCIQLPSGNKMSLLLRKFIMVYRLLVYESSGLGSGLGQFYYLPASRH